MSTSHTPKDIWFLFIIFILKLLHLAGCSSENERTENERPENGRPENERPENGRPENGKSVKGMHCARFICAF